MIKTTLPPYPAVINFMAIALIGLLLTPALAQSNNYEKVIENGKTIYKKKANSKVVAKPKLNTNEKVKVDMYYSTGCKKCVPSIMTILDYDVTFLRKNIVQKKQFKKELFKRTGSEKTPVIFINNKEIRSLSPSIIKTELRKTGAQRKPTLIQKSKGTRID